MIGSVTLQTIDTTRTLFPVADELQDSSKRRARKSRNPLDPNHIITILRPSLLENLSQKSQIVSRPNMI